MKPKDLKFPFKWEERRPLVQERVFFVPKYYDEHQNQLPVSFPSLFMNDHPISIEFCSGNGAWIVNRALENPQKNYIAVEKQFERVRKIWSKMQNMQLLNLFICCTEALTFTRYYLPDNICEAIFVNFPDPWPKTKHAKHRLFQSPFIRELTRIVKKGGSATLVTDDPIYRKQMYDEMTQEKMWDSTLAAPFYVTDWDNYGTSYFEELWRNKGRSIFYLDFKNQKS